jgi:hypothetical protein
MMEAITGVVASGAALALLVIDAKVAGGLTRREGWIEDRKRRLGGGQTWHVR